VTAHACIGTLLRGRYRSAEPEIAPQLSAFGDNKPENDRLWSSKHIFDTFRCPIQRFA
jgi:hypothetical protein